VIAEADVVALVVVEHQEVGVVPLEEVVVVLVEQRVEQRQSL
jgi:hypothetical protein